MTVPTLGRLERVPDIRTVWPGEATHFTPWLAQPENIKLLGDAIGLDLEVEAQEKSVGPFSADILCKETVTGHYVVIENQIERTDHTHLGQLLTYAAGLDAVNIVWVARQFAAEHRAALDWLNRATSEGIHFFGLELEVWRIGDSAMAPKFNVVSQPNDWAKTVKETAAAVSGGAPSPIQQLHLDYWTQLKESLEQHNSTLRIYTATKDAWKAFGVGRSNFNISLVNQVFERWSAVQLTCGGPDGKAHYGLLKARHREAIEQELGPVEWRDQEGYVESYIRVRHMSDPNDRSTWPALNDWFRTTGEKWQKFFKPLVLQLDAAEWHSALGQVGEAETG